MGTTTPRMRRKSPSIDRSHRSRRVQSFIKGLRGLGVVAVNSVGIVKGGPIHRIITIRAAHRGTPSRQVRLDFERSRRFHNQLYPREPPGVEAIVGVQQSSIVGGRLQQVTPVAIWHSYHTYVWSTSDLYRFVVSLLLSESVRHRALTSNRSHYSDGPFP
jgi:hypothetical protein